MLVLVVLVGAYYFRSYIFLPAPCTEPIPYTLGAFSPEFKIPKEDFFEALTQAESAWEAAIDRDLFTYKTNAESLDVLKINLVYDYRQEATEKLKKLGFVVENTKTSYDQLKGRFDLLKTTYEQEKQSFNRQVTSFNQKSQNYQKDVMYWNNRGGAPKGEYQKLQSIQAELENESKRLKVSQDRLEQMTDEINTLVFVLNRMAGLLNLSVGEYNDINTARGESFEEGVYSSDGTRREIDIYEFSNRDKLVRVLMHELGHALGIGHLAYSGAIMYELNEGNNTTLSEADINALAKICGLEQ